MHITVSFQSPCKVWPLKNVRAEQRAGTNPVRQIQYLQNKSVQAHNHHPALWERPPLFIHECIDSHLPPIHHHHPETHPGGSIFKVQPLRFPRLQTSATEQPLNRSYKSKQTAYQCLHQWRVDAWASPCDPLVMLKMENIVWILVCWSAHQSGKLPLADHPKQHRRVRFLQGLTITLNKFLFHPPSLPPSDWLLQPHVQERVKCTSWSLFVGMLTDTHLLCHTFAPMQPCLSQNSVWIFNLMWRRSIKL